MKIGWIGMGAIGAPMALRLVDAGHELVVWGRTASRLAPAIERGARSAGSPAEVARACELLCLCVTDGAAVEAVVCGPGGVCEGATDRTLVIDHSTIEPARSRELAARLAAAAGGRWLDAPVSGGAAGARAGTLAIFVGGDAADLARARPVLEAYGKHVTHAGPAGAGQAVKSCNQAVFATTIAAWIEVLAYARGLGLDPTAVVRALAGSWSDSQVREHLAPHLASGRLRFSAGDLLHKDLAIVAEAARAAGVEMDLLEIAEAVLKR